jgi:transposase
MANFLEYNPEQAYLLPPTVREVLGEGHLCFFVHGAVEKLDLQEFEAGYSDEGPPAYHPALLLKVWLYAYALGMTSSRRLEQRIREDFAFRYLAGGAQPDFWALNEFRKRHGRAMNDIFTQVVELARSLGLGKLGHVAIDSTRIAANASTSCTDSLEKLRAERAKIRKNIRRWQQQCASDDPNEGAGLEVARAAMEKLQRTASRNSRAAAAPEEVRNAETFSSRRGQPLSAGPPGIHAGLPGDADGKRRSFDRGPTDQSGTERQRAAGADGGQRAARVRRAAETSECGQRLFLSAKPRSHGTTWNRCVCAGQQHGLCFASWRNTETTYQSCGPSSHAQQVSFNDRTNIIPTAESVG